MRPKWHSAVLPRLILMGAGTAAAVATGMFLLPKPVGPASFVILLAAGILFAVVFAFLLTHDLDARVLRIREFAESHLASADRWIDTDMDQLGALDLSVRQMAGQTKNLVEQTQIEGEQRNAILGAMAEGVLAVDNQLRVTFSNQALVRMVGGRAPSVGTPLIELVRDTGFIEALTKVVQTRESARWHMHFPAADGLSFEVLGAPLNSGGHQGAIAILHDITDLERLENVRRDFVANVSHEFRTPLAAIAGYAETLLDGAILDESHNRRFLEIIHSNAIRLNSIASDLLTLSELQSNSGLQKLESVKVDEAIDSALSTVASEAQLRGIVIHRGEVANLRILGSRLLLEQVVVNLLANAVKFNQPNGEVTVETKVDQSEINIVVSDTGVGIPSSDLPRIFERFYRVDKARSRQVGGTGLGLSIVKHSVERMNGKVRATSQLGRGSVFTITLPLANPLQ